MQFAIGYQQPDNGEAFSDMVTDYRAAVSEVYFPWVGTPSGRPMLGHSGDLDSDAISRELEDELQVLRRLGVKLDLLLNGNCYGGRAVSRELEDEVTGIIEHLGKLDLLPEIVTTASPAVAHMLKKHFSEIEVRASVNMRIGTTAAMGYVADLFDSFYLQRDRQRNRAYVAQVHDWCRANGKKLCLLANSGCLRFCPGQTFHDNLIAHSVEAERMENLSDWNPHVCWNLYRKPENYVEFLKSTWIRPEDLSLYEGIVDTVKLATRQHAHPRMVIGAYADRHFAGNLLELTEPGFAPAFAPNFIDNTAFPLDWAERTGNCSSDCDRCSYCDSALKTVLKSYADLYRKE